MSTSSTTNRSVSHRLAEHVGTSRFEKWFEHSTTVNVDDNTLHICAESKFLADWIRKRFASELQQTAQETIGRDADVDVRFDPSLTRRDNNRPGDDAAADAPDAVDHTPAETSQPSTRNRPNERNNGSTTRRHLWRRLEDFVVGPSNELAYGAAARLATPHDPHNVSPLFVHGECGVGKTHLLQGICRRYLEHGGRSSAIRYVTGEQFTNEYITSVRSGGIDRFRNRYRKVELLAIDDVHFLANKVSTQNEFLHTIDTIGLTGARVVLACDEHPNYIKQFSQALISRFISGLVVQVERPDRQTRIALIRRLIEQRGLRINDAAVEMIASRCGGSVRELQGAVTKLMAIQHHSPQHNGSGEIGIVLVEQLFGDSSWRPKTPVRIGNIIDAVCQRLEVERSELTGSGRHRRVVLARALVAAIARELTTLSYPEIARALNRRHHSTIHTAEQRLRRQMRDGESLERSPAMDAVPVQVLFEELKHEAARTARKT